MENEIMDYEENMETMVYPEEVETEDSGMSTGKVVLLGAGVALATAAIVKLGKKLYAKAKARKELRKPDQDKIIEVTDEDIETIAD